MNRYDYKFSNKEYIRRSGCERFGYSVSRKKVSYVKVLSVILKALFELVCSEGFSAVMCGVSLFMAIGVVGSVECGTISFSYGAFWCVVYGAVMLLFASRFKD